jgi:hypothetical protein
MSNLSGLDSLPPVPQSAIDHMVRESQQKMQEMEPGPQQQVLRTPPPIDNMIDEQGQQPEEAPEEIEATQQSFEQQIPPTFAQTDYAKNMRALREKAERAERERDDLMRLIRENSQPKPSKPQANNVEEQAEEDLDIDPDALIEGKQFKKLYNEMKSLKNEVNRYKAQTHEEQIQIKLNAQFPDFDNVVTPENLKLFAELEPEIATTIRGSKDIYSGAVTAYKMIKKLGLIEPQSPEKQVVQRNAVKPRSSNSVSAQSGDTPLSRANAFGSGLTPELRTQLLKEMEQYRNTL